MANNLRFDPSTWHDARVRASPHALSLSTIHLQSWSSPRGRVENRSVVDQWWSCSMDRHSLRGQNWGLRLAMRKPNLKTKHRGISSLIRGRLGCDPQPVLEGRKVYLSCPKTLRLKQQQTLWPISHEHYPEMIGPRGHFPSPDLFSKRP